MKTKVNTQNCEKECMVTLRVCLFLGYGTNDPAQEGKAPVGGAKVRIFHEDDGKCADQASYEQDTTDGCAEFDLEAGRYYIGLPFLPGGSSCHWTGTYGKVVAGGKVGPVPVQACQCTTIEFVVSAEQTGLAQYIETKAPGCAWDPCTDVVRGTPARIVSILPKKLGVKESAFFANKGELSQPQESSNSSKKTTIVPIETSDINGSFVLSRTLKFSDDLSTTMASTGTGWGHDHTITGDIKTTTSLTRTETEFTEDVAFWTAIRNSTDALSFNTYLRFMDWIFCGGQPPQYQGTTTTQNFEAKRFFAKGQEFGKLTAKRFLPFTDSDAYRVVKAATEAFVMVNCGVLTENGVQPFEPQRDNDYLDRRDLPTPTPARDLKNVFNDEYLVEVNKNGGEFLSGVLPYLAVIRKKLPDIPIKTAAFGDTELKDVVLREGIVDNCFGILQDKLVNPCLLELIWSYWHEEGMLVQTVNAITRRFQNVRAPTSRDPLSNLEMDPLRPLNNLFWGYIQDEQHRLTVARRHYEYDHHYGLRLEGKAVQNFRPVDTRSKFLEAFHHLLRLCTVFYKQDDDTTVKADAFPVLNALKEVHLILSQGAHNQFGDLPSTARIEMLMQEWLLARPEFREFLPTRIMVAYPETWMDRVDAMKKVQGWTDTSVLHFRNLGVFGEQLLLSIRWGHWSDEFEPVKALNWARFFRPQGQGYIHAYRAVTGVDLSADPTVDMRVDSTLPSVLLQKRLASQKRAS